MKGVLERDHGLALGKGACGLDRILHRLGAAVHEESALLVAPRRESVHPLGQRDIGLVGRHRETDVGEVVELLPHRGDHLGVAMTGVHHADATAEVDEPVAVGVGEHAVLSVHHRDRSGGWNAPGYGLRAAGGERLAIGAGNRGLELDGARHRATPGLGTGEPRLAEALGKVEGHCS